MRTSCGAAGGGHRREGHLVTTTDVVQGAWAALAALAEAGGAGTSLQLVYEGFEAPPG
jgi:hypothetical protein